MIAVDRAEISAGADRAVRVAKGNAPADSVAEVAGRAALVDLAAAEVLADRAAVRCAPEVRDVKVVLAGRAADVVIDAAVRAADVSKGAVKAGLEVRVKIVHKSSFLSWR